MSVNVDQLASVHDFPESSEEAMKKLLFAVLFSVALSLLAYGQPALVVNNGVAQSCKLALDNPSNVTSFSCALPAGVVGGADDLIAVPWIGYFSGADIIVRVTDDQGDIFTVPDFNGCGGYAGADAYFINPVPGAKIITVTVSQPVNYSGLEVDEYNGVTSLVTHAVNCQPSLGIESDALTSGPITTPGAALVLGGSHPGVTTAPGTGFTATPNNSGGEMDEYQVLTSADANAVRATGTVSVVGGGGTTEAMVFDSPSTSGGGGMSCNGTPSGTICIDYSQNGGSFPPVWPYLSVPSYTNGRQMDQDEKNIGIKYQRMFYSPAIWSCGPGCYDFSADDTAYLPGGWGDDNLINTVINQGAIPVLNICAVPSWLGSNINGPPNNYPQFTEMWAAALEHIATTYPQIIYLECFNEPDFSHTSTDVDNMYSAIISAVKLVDARTGHHFMIGGPAACCLNSGVLENFLSYIVSNRLELDFVSWHSYDGNVGGGAQQVQSILASEGVGSTLLQLVTEWTPTPPTWGLKIPWSNTTAAGDAVSTVQGWNALLSAGLGDSVQPYFLFPLECFNNDPNSSLFVTGPIGGTPDGATCPGPDGPVMPIYNAYRMISAHKANLVSYKGINDQIGLSPIASEDSTGVTLMIASIGGGSVNINLVNLPAAFQSGSFTYAEYLIDPYTSNYAYSTSSDGSLQEVGNGSKPASTSFATSFSLNSNAILLIVLTPP